MDRRRFLSTSGTVGLAALAGCTDRVNELLNGENDGQNGRETNTEQNNPESFRVDFEDATGTLGHVAENYSSDQKFDNAVNNFSEDEWLEFEKNDIDRGEDRIGGGVWTEGDLAEHLDEIQPFVEYTMGMQDDIPGYEPSEVTDSRGITPEEIRNSDLDWAHKLAWGSGFGVDEVLPKVDSGSESTRTVFPAIEYFNRELLESDRHVETVIVYTKEPETPTDRSMTHKSGIMSYSIGDQPLKLKHIEGTIGGGLPVPRFDQAIGNPEDSIYADPSIDKAASPLEYRKALRLTREGKINTENSDSSIDESMGSLSNALVSTLWSYVDAAPLGLEIDTPNDRTPLVDNPNKLREEFGGSMRPNYITPNFGRSLEDNFDEYDRETEQKFENIGRGIETFYRAFDYGTPLAIDGTIEDPEFYKLGVNDMRRAWNEHPEDISELL